MDAFYQTFFFGLLMVLNFGLTSVSAALPTTKAKLNEAATLYCNGSCSGVIRWHRGGQQVASCGPDAKSGLEFTCQINEGESSVTIPQVNYSTRGYYWVTCDDRELFACRQLLQPHPVESAVEKEAGDHVRLDLHTPEPVIISFIKSRSSSPIQVCTVDKRVLQCMTEYEERVLIVGKTFVLMNVTFSDSGSYTVQEKDGILVSTSHVTVVDKQKSYRDLGIGIAVGLLLEFFLCHVVAGAGWMRLKRRCRRPDNDKTTSEEKSNGSASESVTLTSVGVDTGT